MTPSWITQFPSSLTPAIVFARNDTVDIVMGIIVGVAILTAVTVACIFA